MALDEVDSRDQFHVSTMRLVTMSCSIRLRSHTQAGTQVGRRKAGICSLEYQWLSSAKGTSVRPGFAGEYIIVCDCVAARQLPHSESWLCADTQQYPVIPSGCTYLNLVKWVAYLGIMYVLCTKRMKTRTECLSRHRTKANPYTRTHTMEVRMLAEGDDEQPICSAASGRDDRLLRAWASDGTRLRPPCAGLAAILICGLELGLKPDVQGEILIRRGPRRRTLKGREKGEISRSSAFSGQDR
ncbi:hypothetical protein DM02DRAFT_684360 [Periconia macrospinosa]|uniref:Uncharacterized protein n=1 Tax=Periconia macrospinosa TaxID=97972 RepID=A0A2V1DHS0_9PLEO|nr:hypothetical protein DM02DRAFT_684360 [Periconia macrospinosa]